VGVGVGTELVVLAILLAFFNGAAGFECTLLWA
jgi:hypothetical protein